MIFGQGYWHYWLFDFLVFVWASLIVHVQNIERWLTLK
jgi:hypothetical protein